MATVAGLAEAMALATHVPKPEIQQRIRALREAGRLPTAASRHSIPRVTARQSIELLLAVLIGGPIKNTIENALAYGGLREDGGADLNLAAALEAELEKLNRGTSRFEALHLIEKPLVASISTADGVTRFNDAGPVRYATRVVTLHRRGLEIIARALT